MKKHPFYFSLIISWDCLHFFWQLIFCFSLLWIDNADVLGYIMTLTSFVTVTIQAKFALRSSVLEFSMDCYYFHKEYLASKFVCWLCICFKVIFLASFSSFEYLGDFFWAIFHLHGLLTVDAVLDKLKNQKYEFIGATLITEAEQNENDFDVLNLKCPIIMETLGNQIIYKSYRVVLGKLINREMKKTEYKKLFQFFSHSNTKRNLTFVDLNAV